MILYLPAPLKGGGAFVAFGFQGKTHHSKNKRKCCFRGQGKVWVLRNETLTRAVLKLVR
jgi:hypothetical protein